MIGFKGGVTKCIALFDTSVLKKNEEYVVLSTQVYENRKTKKDIWLWNLEDRDGKEIRGVHGGDIKKVV